MGYRGKPPVCGHPDRPHYSFGNCRACYNKAYLAANPEQQAKQREQQKGYVKKHRRAKRAFTNNLKMNKPCLDCGKVYPPYVMEFDHVRGEKAFDVGRARGRFSKERLLKEIEKCELVCANCHRQRTWDRKNEQWPELWWDGGNWTV